MKLKDIFNIDLSTRGGVKLYRKIMGKYNIPKQDSKQLVKEIRNSSEGGGIKEYYYSINPNKMIEALEDDLTGLNMMLVFFNRLIMGAVSNTDTGSLIHIDYQHISNFTDIDTVKEIRGGRIIDSYPITITKHQDNHPVYCDVYGDFYNRCVEMFKGFDEGVTAEQIKEMTSSYITEITKEEYEALIEVPNVIIGK